MPVDLGLIAAIHVDRARHGDLARPSGRPEEVFQVSTIAALLEGRYDGDLSIGELLGYGDLGLGTLDGLDGEMLVLDGVAWQGTMDGSLRRIGAEERTPFAVVVPFVAETVVPIAVPTGEALGLDALQQAIDGLIPDPTRIWAIRIEAEVRSITVRSVPRQVPPYPPLVAVTEQEALFELPAGRMTIVGFRFPDALGGIGVPGYHLHAADAARAQGGHVLSLGLVGGTVALDHADTLHLELPAGVGDAIAAASAEEQARIAAAEVRIPGR